MATVARTCAACDKGQSQLSRPLKDCAKCRGVSYRSRECQKADWKSHTKTCAATASSTSASPQLRFRIERPFNALQKGIWLHDRPEQDVYQLMSDVFRMRREDKYKYEQFVEEGSVYTAGGSAESEIKNYRRFLQRVTDINTSKPVGKRVLPSWWSSETINKCAEVATTNRDAMVGFAVEKHDIQEFYKQDDMPMQLRMFGEALDGTKIMGESAAEILQIRADLENNPSGRRSTLISLV